ncbi:hypothetical protein H9L39_02910 [Fusarium oxysporum f. sp. albedinis]|nr:hypothetical protein H9L39_02910 [Fusarium oxysporum f. sp. albedinis]
MALVLVRPPPYKQKTKICLLPQLCRFTGAIFYTTTHLFPYLRPWRNNLAVFWKVNESLKRGNRTGRTRQP